MAELVDTVASRIAAAVAEDLVKERGKGVTPTVIALHVAELFEDLSEMGSSRVIDLAEAYVKAADVSVHVPYHRMKDDGTLFTNEELREQVAKEMW